MKKICLPIMNIGLGGVSDGYGPELHTSANAASDPNGNEADATTGFTQRDLDLGANVFESQSAVKNTGLYAIHANCNDTPDSNANFYVNLTAAPFNLSNGDEVKIEFGLRHVGVGNEWVAALSSSVNLRAVGSTEIIEVDTPDTVFQSVVYEFTMTADTALFGCQEANGSNDGGVYFDNMSVRKKL